LEYSAIRQSNFPPPRSFQPFLGGQRRSRRLLDLDRFKRGQVGRVSALPHRGPSCPAAKDSFDKLQPAIRRGQPHVTACRHTATLESVFLCLFALSNDTSVPIARAHTPSTVASATPMRRNPRFTCMELEGSVMFAPKLRRQVLLPTLRINPVHCLARWIAVPSIPLLNSSLL
jgi:hypothetical protein